MMIMNMHAMWTKEGGENAEIDPWGKISYLNTPDSADWRF